MNALVHPGSAASVGAESQFETRAAIAANREWEVDRALMLQRSERRGWIVGGVGILVAIISALAVLAHGALHQVVGIPIVVDKTTGETTIEQRLSAETIPPMEALDKHNLAVFVRAREGYSWWFLQRDFDQVSRMAIPTVFADYNRQFEGQDALQKKLAGAEEWRINVVGLRLAPSGRRGNGGIASISYEKVVHLTDRNIPDVTTRHAASVVYEYQPKVLAKEKDRIENPFGFVVTAYRSDPEIATAPGSVAAKQ
jgi:type IV secretion system protein VirB8